jgi:hypothetical protein
LRREGRRKRKAGAKNEKAVLIIAPLLCRGQGKILQISKENKFFYKKTPFLQDLKEGKSNLSLCKKQPQGHYGIHPAPQTNSALSFLR